METKFKFKLLSILCATIFFMSLSSFTTKTDPKPVDLSGAYDKGTQRSLTSDFFVTVDANSINIEYGKDNSNITVEVTAATGQTVYEEEVNPVAGEGLTIDISDWAEGSYHISFTNTSGECIYGDFEVVH